MQIQVCSAEKEFILLCPRSELENHGKKKLLLVSRQSPSIILNVQYIQLTLIKPEENVAFFLPSRLKFLAPPVTEMISWGLFGSSRCQ